MNRLSNTTLYWMFDNADGRIVMIFIKYDDQTTIIEMTELPMHRLVKYTKFVIKLMMMMFL